LGRPGTPPAFLGDLIAGLLAIPVLGMVIGLVLLLADLGLDRRWLGPERAVPQTIRQLAKGLHDNFGLLFLPAGLKVTGAVRGWQSRAAVSKLDGEQMVACA
jgi:putative effector of murein hydrolase LrgA (UPF0299 family)